VRTGFPIGHAQIKQAGAHPVDPNGMRSKVTRRSSARSSMG
jgi:hypothetical protein